MAEGGGKIMVCTRKEAVQTVLQKMNYGELSVGTVTYGSWGARYKVCMSVIIYFLTYLRGREMASNVRPF